MSQRTRKVESLVRQTVANGLLEVLGPAMAAVTVTAVEVSPDLRQATVWIGIVGDHAEAIFADVENQREELQRRVAATLTTKFVPKLTLRQDSGGAYAQHIEDLLKQS